MDDLNIRGCPFTKYLSPPRQTGCKRAVAGMSDHPNPYKPSFIVEVVRKRFTGRGQWARSGELRSPATEGSPDLSGLR